MRGTYCIVCDLPKRATIRIGALGVFRFAPGTYVYVGSAQTGVEGRVRRHMSKQKKKRWHIDYFLQKAEVVGVFAVPCESKHVECRIADAILTIPATTIPVLGFGSSDCRCRSHLICFGEETPEAVSEALAYQLSMLQCMYPRDTRGERHSRWRRE